MNRIVRVWIALFLIFGQTGCGTQIALSGKAREDYLKSIRNYIEYWESDGVMAEARSRDAIDCGGSWRGTDFPNERIAQAKREGENDRQTRSRLTRDWQRCMIEKGYRFTGKCYDNEVGRNSPACAGRALEPRE